MKRLLLLIVFAFSLFAGCSKKESGAEAGTVEYFKQHLTAGMNYTAITQTFGQPAEDKGSGIHIYVYNLKDGTSIWIGYTDKILYARQVDSSGQLIASSRLAFFAAAIFDDIANRMRGVHDEIQNHLIEFTN